jgi:uncharacterized protein YbjQ (UPF0145 family)
VVGAYIIFALPPGRLQSAPEPIAAGNDMNMRKTTCSLIAATLLSIAGVNATAQDRAPAIRVYDATELALQRYTVVKRLWAGTWRSSFWVSTDDDAPAALKALTEKAADLEADGVTNVHCVSEAAGAGGFFCYGLAIKLK